MPTRRPTFTWKPYVSATGIYTVNLLVPGCTNLQDCVQRTSVKVRGIVPSCTNLQICAKWPSVKVAIELGNRLQAATAIINQQVTSDSVQNIYNGPIIQTTIVPTTGWSRSDGQYDLVVDRVQLQPISASTSGTQARLLRRMRTAVRLRMISRFRLVFGPESGSTSERYGHTSQ